MYALNYTPRMRRKLRKLARSGAFDAEKFRELQKLLQSGKPLPHTYKDHQLQGALQESRECHLSFDVLVQYKRNESLKLITIENIGSHPDLFGS